MKKFLTLLLVLIFVSSPVFAKKQKDYRIKFSGQKYTLLYSIKNPDFGGYLNEYYKTGETYNTWSEMLAVHHFPNAYSPIDQVKQFREYLGSMNCPSALTFDDKKNVAMIDFLLINNNQVPIILEFNIFKYQKSKKCGSIALQYAKRYAVTTAMQVDEAKRDFEKSRKKAIKKIKHYEIPMVVAEDIDKCKYTIASEEKEKATEENTKEEIAINNEEASEINDLENSKEAAEKNTTSNCEKEECSVISDEKTLEREEKEKIERKEDVVVKEANQVEAEEMSAAETKQNVKENKQEYAPVPVEEDVKQIKQDKKSEKKEKKVKKSKEEVYTLEHNNSDFYTEPRNYKQVRSEKKKEIKQKKKEIKESKKLKKQEKKRIKAEKKKSSKKAKKERAKNASKALEEQ